MIVRWKGRTVTIRPQRGDDPADVALTLIALKDGSPLLGLKFQLVRHKLLPWTEEIGQRAALLMGPREF